MAGVLFICPTWTESIKPCKIKGIRFRFEPQASGQFYYEGRDYEFNFSKFWTGSRTFFDCTETDTQILWKVTQTTFRAKMEAEIACNKEEMLLINYESPDGFKRHTRLWNCGNGFGTVRLYEKRQGRWQLIDEMEAGSVGCEYGEYGA